MPSPQRNDWAPPAQPHPHQAGGNSGPPPCGRLPQGGGHWGGGQGRASLPPRSDWVPPAGVIPYQAGGGDGRHPTGGGPPPCGVDGGGPPDQGLPGRKSSARRRLVAVCRSPAAGSRRRRTLCRLKVAANRVGSRDGRRCRRRLVLCCHKPAATPHLRGPAAVKPVARGRRRRPTCCLKAAGSRHRRLQINHKLAAHSPHPPNSGRRQPPCTPRLSRR